MKKTFVATTIAAAALSATVLAQGPAPAQADAIRLKQRLSNMEAVLQRAVSSGAEDVLRQMQSIMSDRPFLDGLPQVRGFRLEGHGVFFYVQVPGLQMPIMWSMRHLMQAPDRNTAVTVQRLTTLAARVGGAEGDELLRIARQLEAQLATDAPRPAGIGRAVSAATVVAGVQPPVQPAAPAIDSELLENPHAAYTREVKEALIEAMLEYSQALAIGDNEFLTVAARDAQPSNPLMVGDPIDFTTWIVRVRGSDLAALAARTITMDEARARVEIREE